MTIQPAAIDPTSALPLYVQAEALLLGRIESGEWRPGSRIPSETELCEQYGVSRVTIRQALARLVDRGMLTRERAKGTFVRDNRISANARYATSFSNELRQLGMKSGSRVLEITQVPASAEVAHDLRCPAGTPLISVHRLRTADGQPIGVQTSLLVADLVPGIADVMTDDQSLYDVLRRVYSLVPVEAAEVFRVTRVPSAYAKLLDVRAGSPVFHAQRITFDDKRAFEHTTSYLRGDRYEIRFALRNP